MARKRETQAEYEDEHGRTWSPVSMTPYDRRLKELRDLEAKRDAVLSKAERSNEDTMRLTCLEPLISQAQERFDSERKHAESDIGRLRYRIDNWRSNEGKDDYNASRRNKRDKPNADLSRMTPEQIAQRERDRSADSKWLNRRRAKGMDEEALAQAYEQHLEQRNQKRERERMRERQNEIDQEILESHPNWNLMG